MSEAKAKLDSPDINDLKKAAEALSSASHKVAEEMYKSATPPSGDQGGAGTGGQSSGSSDTDNPNNPKVVDADFEETK